MDLYVRIFLGGTFFSHETELRTKEVLQPRGPILKHQIAIVLLHTLAFRYRLFGNIRVNIT